MVYVLASWVLQVSFRRFLRHTSGTDNQSLPRFRDGPNLYRGHWPKRLWTITPKPSLLQPIFECPFDVDGLCGSSRADYQRGNKHPLHLSRNSSRTMAKDSHRGGCRSSPGRWRHRWNMFSVCIAWQACKVRRVIQLIPSSTDANWWIQRSSDFRKAVDDTTRDWCPVHFDHTLLRPQHPIICAFLFQSWDRFSCIHSHRLVYSPTGTCRVSPSVTSM